MNLVGPWAGQAACRGMDPEIFFDPSRYKEARNICATCPVMKECQEHAIEYEEYGFWGGLGPEERARRRRDTTYPP